MKTPPSSHISWQIMITQLIEKSYEIHLLSHEIVYEHTV